MKFEYDSNKSLANKLKHGIDFEEAQLLWDDDFLEFLVDFQEERRFLVIGKIHEKFWSAVIAYRTASVRIISVRRSRKREIDLYEENYC